ncbi:MAG: transposase [Synergistaceae bacterium]|nr:transposase [Synergistaceae bacterium]
MDTSILKRDLERTCGEFVDGMFSGRMGACALRQAKFLLCGVVEHGTTLVSALAKGLRPDRRTSPKKQREMVSRHLGRLELLPALQEALRGEARLAPGTPVAVDCSDLGKEFGGHGMEGMELGHDGSTGGKSMGHLFVSAATVPGSGGVARPFWMKLAMGRHGAPGLVAEAVRKVGDLSGRKAVCIVDRGGDGMPTLRVLAGEGHRAVVRIAKMDRDVFGTGRGIDRDLAARRPCRCFLKRNSGRMQEAFVRWRVGFLDIGADGTGDARPDCRRVLVVESHFDGKSLYFYRTLGEGELPGERPPKDRLRALAVQTAQLYLQRWQIETSFLRVKQDFGLEDARVRTFKRLENLFALCYMAYLFVHFHMPGCRRYRWFVKVVKDNFDTVSLRAEVMLANLRTLLREAFARLITGRPRKKTRHDAFPEQLEFQFQ